MQTESQPMPREVSLDDKYALADGQLYMTGSQALVRLPIVQLARDFAAGLDTACFISGYRGSPMHNLDKELWRAERFLQDGRIRFQPAVNEDLAATSLWGSQMTGLFGEARNDGVFGLWYGKGPGLDRSLDAIRHANLAGTSPHGGVLAIVGDDHGMMSSDVPATSEPTFADLMLPTLYPGSVQELLDLGLYGIALSRFCGAWVGFKAVSDTLDAVATVNADARTPQIVLPEDFEFITGSVHIREPDPWKDQEPRMRLDKLRAALEFARVNELNRPLWRAPRRRFGIVASGKAVFDVLQALRDLGLEPADAADVGIEVLKISMPFPSDPQMLRAFARGMEEVLVIDEKRRVLEVQLKDAAYALPESERPIIVGRVDEEGMDLVSPLGELDADGVARALARRIRRFHDTDALRGRLAYLDKKVREQSVHALINVARTPYFCSGCPHNSSTKVPAGGLALGGVGCHFMATYMDRNNQTHTHMGGEGAPWIGLAPFTTREHVFQNMGDGTYFHSGLLAIRACIAANVNITYKILFNDAVAMTGGQPVDGVLTPVDISRQVHAEGVRRIVVVTEDLSRSAPASSFAPGTELRHRDDLDETQQQLAAEPGVSVMIYDQTCAAQKRRRRKRGQLEDPTRRVFINQRVCEGCGDCGEQSNCLSVLPVDTPLGRKRRIDQSSCNKDYSCVKGFCPSFVSLPGAVPRKVADEIEVPRALQLLPEPQRPTLPEVGTYNVLVTGIGGTGVVTVGAMLTMAAHLEGNACSSVDQFGMAQKGGAVTSHLRLARSADAIQAVRLGTGSADLVLGCDNLVAASDAALNVIRHGRTHAIINTNQAITGQFVREPDRQFPLASIEQRLADTTGPGFEWLDATRIATALMGDAIAANLFMLGFAYQRGCVPVAAPSIERAIELNAVAVASNKRAFNWGRRYAHDGASVDALLNTEQADVLQVGDGLDEQVAMFAGELRNYQDDAYADRFTRFVSEVQCADMRNGFEGELVGSVAAQLFKLMAYKDEYEVARLYTDGTFAKELEASFENVGEIELHLAPPFLNFGRAVPRKVRFGGWIMSAMRVLASVRWLRGGVLDLFGYSAERRAERAWIERYQSAVQSLLPDLGSLPREQVLRVAAVPGTIRGYGHIKTASMVVAQAALEDALNAAREAAPHTPRVSVAR
jgi:indolepyruvate ferredoxin oxidoreductase